MHLVDDLQEERTDYLGKDQLEINSSFSFGIGLSWRNEILKSLLDNSQFKFCKLNVKNIFSIGCGLKVKTEKNYTKAVK